MPGEPQPYDEGTAFAGSQTSLRRHRLSACDRLCTVESHWEYAGQCSSCPRTL